MKPHERRALLDRVERDGATVGATIPERLTVQGEAVALQAEILTLQRASPLLPQQADRAKALTVLLRRERTERVRRLEEAPIDRETGEELVEAVIGIDRALAALAGIGEEVDIEGEMKRREIEDRERWRAFIKKVKGGIDRGIDR